MTLKPFTLLYLTIFISISASPAWSLVSNTPEKVSLQLKWTHQFQFAGYYAAKEQGYYADAGLDVEFIERTADIDPIKQVMSGKTQYGVSDSSIVLEFSKGTQIKALAAIFQHSPLVFISKKSSLITNPFEMKGKRIMLEEFEAYAPLRAFFLGAGLRENDYISVKHTYDNGSLIGDEVDVISAYSTNAPFYYQEHGVEINIINPQDYGVDFYGDILFASTQETIDHPERVRRFKRATIKGWHYALVHQEELVQLIHNKYNSKLSLNGLRYEAKEIAKLISAGTTLLGEIKASRLLRTADVYAQLYKTKKLSISDIRSFIQSDDGVRRITLTPQEQIWLHEHHNLKFTGDPDWLPYEAFDDKGEYIGIVADHLKLIEKHSGIKFNIVASKTWQESVEKVRDGKIDIISETVDSSLSDIMAFTKPYLSSPIIIVMNDKQAYVNNIAQIADKKIALIKGYGYIGYITDAYPELDYHWVDNLQQGLEAVSSGKVDVLLSTLAQTSYVIANSAIQNIRIVGKTEFSNDLALGVKKEYAPVLIPLLNRALDAITKQQKKQIFDEWGKVELTLQVDYRIAIQVAIGLLLLLSLVLYWNRTLQKQIKARKQSEQLLRKNKSQLSTLVNAIPDLVWLKDKEGIYLSCNPAFEKLFGAKEANIVGKTDYDFVDKEQADFFREHDRLVMLTNKPRINEEKLTFAKEGCQGLFETIKTPIFDAEELLVGVLGIARDITDRKKLETLLKDKEERLALAASHNGVGVWDLNPQTLELVWDDSMFSLYNMQQEDFSGALDAWNKSLHPDDRERSKEELQDAISGKKPFDTEFRVIWPNGEIHDIKAVAKVFRDKDDVPIRMLGTNIDISKQKHAEHDLRIAATAFESQEGMMVSDADNVIIRVNKAFTIITGYKEEEAIGNNPSMLSSGRHDALFYEAMWKAINTTDYWEGEVWNKRKNSEEYPEKLTITAVKNSAGIVTNYVGTITDITLRKQAEQEIEDLAYYDPLTHLPNRRLMVDRIHHAMAASARSGKKGALLFLDLDHFKTLNDTLGHDMGDLLLQQIAERLTECVREDDTVSRFGGDEFVVLLEGLSAQSIEAATQTEDIANKVLSSISRHYQLASHHYTCSTSIGITLFDGHKAEVEALLKQADIALYQAKDDGRNALRFFDPQMQESITVRAELEKALVEAIEQQQFQLYYQVQVDNSQNPVGAEALIRWQHPERGIVSPLDFIPIAEQSQTILAIGQWVLDSGCAQLQVWKHDKATCNLTLSVNVSAKQFRQVDFVTQVTMAIRQHEINPALLKLELTESLLLDDVEDTIGKMKALSDMGIQFSLDDFGTGYSSLQYLKQLPLDQLKIDKSFVDDLVSNSNDQVIVRTIIAMAHSLGLTVISEGVETKEQQQCLLAEGCTHYQGYLFSKPLAIAEFNALLKEYGVQ